jgi:MFS family permease
MAAFLPIFGRLADILGRKLLYTGGFLLFVLSSGLCGISPNLPVLIAFRVLQGIGAALLSSNSVAIVVAAGGEMRGRVGMDVPGRTRRRPDQAARRNARSGRTGITSPGTVGPMVTQFEDSIYE